MSSLISRYILKSPKTGVYRYRRAIPSELRSKLGKREFRQSLKTKDEKVATLKAVILADEHDRLFEKLKGNIQTDSNKTTPLQDFLDARNWVRALGFNPETRPENMTDDEWQERMDTASFLEEDLIEQSQSGKTVSQFDWDKLDALRGRDKGKACPSLSEATRIYLQEMNDNNAKRPADQKRGFELETMRCINSFIATVGKDKPLDQLTREDGRNYINALRKQGLAPESINKMFGRVQTVFNFVNTELELGLPSRMKGLKVDDPVPSSRKKRAFSVTEVRQYLEHSKSCNDDARIITILNVFTGTRPGEVRELLVRDIKIDAPVPHIRVEWNEHRRLKKSSTERFIPVVGQAMKAAKEALALAKAAGRSKPDDVVFANYQGRRGMNNLSAVLRKVIRGKMKIKDKLLTPYSTRHTMRDLLRDTLAPQEVIHAIQGWKEGGASVDYGDGYTLKRMREFLIKAHKKIAPL